MKQFNLNASSKYSEEYYKKVISQLETDIRIGLAQWQKSHPHDFEEAYGELNQGNTCEAYYLLTNYLKSIIEYIKEIPRPILLTAFQDYVDWKKK